MTTNPDEALMEVVIERRRKLSPADVRQAEVAARLALIAKIEREASPLAHNPGRS